MLSIARSTPPRRGSASAAGLLVPLAIAAVTIGGYAWYRSHAVDAARMPVAMPLRHAPPAWGARP